MEQLELIRFVVSIAGFIQIFNFHMQTFFFVTYLHTIYFSVYGLCKQFISKFPTPLPIQNKNNGPSIRNYLQPKRDYELLQRFKRGFSGSFHHPAPPHPTPDQMVPEVATVGGFTTIKH